MPSHMEEGGLPSYCKERASPLPFGHANITVRLDQQGDGKAVIEQDAPAPPTAAERAEDCVYWAVTAVLIWVAVVSTQGSPDARAWVALYWLHAALCAASLVVRQHMKERMLVRRGNFVFAAKYQTARMLVALLASGASLCLFALALAASSFGRGTADGKSERVAVFELEVGSLVCMAVSSSIACWAAYNAFLARRAAAQKHWAPQEMEKMGMNGQVGMMAFP